ncbi:MAG: hypothetical protein U0353_00230 [Sandaracinus sp.]
MSGDEYEKKFMEAGETVRHRDKVVWRWGLPLLGGFSLLALALAIMDFTLAASQAGSGALVGAGVGVLLLFASGVLGFTAATLTVLRTVVTDRAVHVQYGLWGPTIPLDAIDSVEIAKYDWTRFGGWGLRGTGDERAFTIQGHDEATLCIRWREGGALKTTWISTDDPGNTALAIERARAAQKAGPRVRVAFDESPPDAAEASESDASSDARDERDTSRGSAAARSE